MRQLLARRVGSSQPVQPLAVKRACSEHAEPTQQHTSAARLLPARVQAVRQQKTALRCAAQYLLMADGQTRADKSSVLFVCLGNICRSPTAEAVFKSVVDRAGRAEGFEIDSCGTGGGNPSWYERGGWSYHEGNPSDPRMQQAAQKRGISLTSRSRPLTPQDLTHFDHIIGMDEENLLAIRTAAEYWRSFSPNIPPSYSQKVKLMTDYLRDPKFAKYKHVPDPYFGGAKGFELVLDLLEDAAEGLLSEIASS